MAITIDEMLDLLSFASTEQANGNANHGPMASEALFALGRDEAVLPWVEDYRNRLIDRPFHFDAHLSHRLARVLGQAGPARGLDRVF